MIEKTLDSPPISSCMTSPCDFQDYLQSLCTAYEQWWEENAFIEEIKDAWFEFVLDGKTKSNKSADEQRATDEQRQEITKPVLRLIEDYRHQKILIVGDPGAGKSTLLKRLLRDAAEKAQKDEQAPIPVFVELKDYKTTGDRAGVRGLILESLESHDPALDEEALKQLLARKRLLLLTDGLNELSYEPAKAELKKLCLHQAIIATSRFANSWWDIDRKLEIQPLTSQQVKQFLEERLPNRDRAEVEKLGKRVRDFGQTPLMVWMLYSIFQANKETPTTRGEAYRSFTALYVEQAKTGLDLAESRFLLSKLAFEMMQSQKPDNPTHFSLDMTEVDAQNRLGSTKTLNQLLSLHLLQASGQLGNRKIRFCHQTLQEYYAAEALLKRLQEHPEWLEKTPKQQWTRFQQDYLNYVKWTEAIALMLGLPEIEEEVEKLVNLSLNVDLYLAGRLAGAVKFELQDRTIGLIADREVSQQIKVEFLGITKSEAAISRLLGVDQTSDFGLRRAAIEALGNISSDQSIAVIIKTLDDPVFEIRRTGVYLLGRTRDKRVIPHLCKALFDPEASVCEAAADALSEINFSEAIFCLVQTLNSLNNKLYQHLSQSLPNINQHTSYEVIKNLEDFPKILFALIDDPVRQIRQCKFSQTSAGDSHSTSAPRSRKLRHLILS